MEFGKKLIESAIWMSASGVMIGLIAFGGNIVLARLLSPKEFGEYALAISVSAMVFVVTSMGAQRAIVQCRELAADRLTGTALWITVAMSMIAALIGNGIGYVLLKRGNTTMGTLIILSCWVNVSTSLAGFCRLSSACYDPEISSKPSCSLFTKALRWAIH